MCLIKDCSTVVFLVSVYLWSVGDSDWCVPSSLVFILSPWTIKTEKTWLEGILFHNGASTHLTQTMHMAPSRRILFKWMRLVLCLIHDETIEKHSDREGKSKYKFMGIIVLRIAFYKHCLLRGEYANLRKHT